LPGGRSSRRRWNEKPGDEHEEDAPRCHVGGGTTTLPVKIGTDRPHSSTVTAA